ncbi:hypothetical protein [Streptomyces sp. enrichment culture]|uniref:hypothetical protein n=1 Tax=Streptomyces sp. enrichment culture TaxID=1795815 RepID=UPI003F56D8AF
MPFSTASNARFALLVASVTTAVAVVTPVGLAPATAGDTLLGSSPLSRHTAQMPMPSTGRH